MIAARTPDVGLYVDHCRDWAVTVRADAGAGLAGMAARLRRFWCGLHGHAMLLHFEPERLSLRCMNCGHSSPGWTVEHRPLGGAPVPYT